MVNVHTIKDLSSGHRLGSAREMELEEALCISSKSMSEFTNKYNALIGAYSNFEKRCNKEKAKLHRNLEQADTNNGKFSERIHNLTSEITQLRSKKDSLNSQVIHKGASLAESKDKVATKSKEIKVLQSKLKALEKDYSSAQMNLSEMDSSDLNWNTRRKNYPRKIMSWNV